MFSIEDLRNKKNFFLLAGPCVIEGEEMALHIAEHIANITQRLDIPFVFKGSYRKVRGKSRLLSGESSALFRPRCP